MPKHCYLKLCPGPVVQMVDINGDGRLFPLCQYHVDMLASIKFALKQLEAQGKAVRVETGDVTKWDWVHSTDRLDESIAANRKALQFEAMTFLIRTRGL